MPEEVLRPDGPPTVSAASGSSICTVAQATRTPMFPGVAAFGPLATTVRSPPPRCLIDDETPARLPTDGGRSPPVQRAGEPDEGDSEEGQGQTAL